MQTIEVPRKDWARTLDEFSVVHDGWLVSLDVLGPALSHERQIHDLPFRGITAETGSKDPAITIAASHGDGEHFTHIIHSPTHVRLERSDGADVALEIETNDGTAAILTFRTAARPDTVDGLPRHH